MGGWTQIFTSAPDYVADPNSIDQNEGGQIDWSRVPSTYRAGTQYTITTTAQSNAAATTLTVSAIPDDLPVGAVLNFAGAGRFATLTAPATKGATTLTVEALDATIPTATAAVYTVSKSGSKTIPGGTVMCRLSGGKIVPRAVRPGSEVAIGLLIGTAIENMYDHALTGYGLIVGGVIYETLLPETITSYKTELGTNGSGWVWLTYADSSEV
jgi:hypothetical protein